MTVIYGLGVIVWFFMWFFEWGDRVGWNEPQEERTKAARMILASPVWFVVVAWFLLKIVWLMVKETRTVLKDARNGR
jgi:hypothetical protein